MSQSFIPPIITKSHTLSLFPMVSLPDWSHHLFPQHDTYLTFPIWKSFCHHLTKIKKKSPRLITELRTLSRSILFEEGLVEELFSCIAKTPDLMNKGGLMAFLEEVKGQKILDIQRFFYFFSNGNEFVVDKMSFISKMQKLNKILTGYMRSSKTLVIHSILEKTENDESKELLENYVKIVEEFKSLGNGGQKIINGVFEESQRLEKKVFLQKILQFRHFPLTYVFELLKLEMKILEEGVVEGGIEGKVKDSVRKKKILKSIRKILNRCEYNGNEICNCVNCRM